MGLVLISESGSKLRAPIASALMHLRQGFLLSRGLGVRILRARQSFMQSPGLSPERNNVSFGLPSAGLGIGHKHTEIVTLAGNSEQDYPISRGSALSP